MLSEEGRLAKEGMEAVEKRKQEAERLVEMAAGSSLASTGEPGVEVKAETQEASEPDEYPVDEAVAEATQLQSQQQKKAKGKQLPKQNLRQNRRRSRLRKPPHRLRAALLRRDGRH